jgi:hypothetical protein
MISCQLPDHPKHSRQSVWGTSIQPYVYPALQELRLTADETQGDTLRRMLSGLADSVWALQGELSTGAAAEKRLRSECHQLMRVEGEVRRAKEEMVAEVSEGSVLAFLQSFLLLRPSHQPRPSRPTRHYSPAPHG